MATADFERLRAIMGEPAYTPARVPWELAPAELGVQLPSDYRAFIDLYGGVNFNGEWGMISPRRDATYNLPGGFAGWRTRADEEFRETVESEHGFWNKDTPVFPDPGGLLPWAMNSNHAYACWLTTDPDPDRWPVAVFDCGEGLDGELELHEGGFARFVATVLTGGYPHQDEWLVTPNPEHWGPQPPRPLWTPNRDWDGNDWGGQWGVSGWSAESWSGRADALAMPWVRH
ncbi:SMI1/KNR4 family protein [Streptomyces sp. NRRL S-350]|uniref:SMI1/KNR4 family protein n=1 Tax=Streptomyces sp. NRRL S-350 TaxID=1463902 RepID=UPI0004BF7C93|nr:SMI1/KNR4 family protein [Streptomyces sp. NRRL S-350]